MRAGAGSRFDNGSGPVQNPALSSADFNTYLAQWQTANGAAFYQNGCALISTFLDSLTAFLVAAGVGVGDTNALAVVKWMHAVYSYYTTNLATVKAWDTPAGMNQAMMSYTSVGACPVTLAALATSVVTALNTKYPGQV